VRRGYSYGFNGKENDSDGEWGRGLIQDYGFRLYNPAASRFLSVDPLRMQYPELTVYQFASNTPIMAVDLDGCESKVVVYSFYTVNGENGVPTIIKTSVEHVRESFDGIYQDNMYDINNNGVVEINYLDGKFFNRKTTKAEEKSTGLMASLGSLYASTKQLFSSVGYLGSEWCKLMYDTATGGTVTVDEKKVDEAAYFVACAELSAVKYSAVAATAFASGGCSLGGMTTLNGLGASSIIGFGVDAGVQIGTGGITPNSYSFSEGLKNWNVMGSISNGAFKNPFMGNIGGTFINASFNNGVEIKIGDNAASEALAGSIFALPGIGLGVKFPNSNSATFVGEVVESVGGKVASESCENPH
jgi:RHS repeat-associated protein